jgi:hypothetical protein
MWPKLFEAKSRPPRRGLSLPAAVPTFILTGSRITSLEPLLRVLRYCHFALVHWITFGSRSKVIRTSKQLSKRYTSFRAKSVSLFAINRLAHCHLATANFHMFRQGYSGTVVTPSPEKRDYRNVGIIGDQAKKSHSD